MSEQIFLVLYIIIFLVIIYYYRSYRYYKPITENFDDVISEEENQYNLKDILHDSFFLNTNKGIKMGGIIKDFGSMFSHKYLDIFIKKPDNVYELQEIIKDATTKKKKVRIRGGGHSCSGISIPRDNELFIDMKNLISFYFDQVGTIIVDAGVSLNDLKRFLDGQGFELPIYPYGVDILDKTSPTVGGFICAGGISPDSKVYGGFWENVLEITLIDGYGRKQVYNQNNKIFPWLFGNYGQMGIIVSAKLKIEHKDKNKDFYPLGKKGIIEQFKLKIRDRKCFFYHILCEKERVDEAETNIRDIIGSEYSTEKDKDNFDIIIYFIKFKNFNPPLLYRNRSFYCVKGVQYVDEKDEEYKKKIKRIEEKFLKIMNDNSLYRYPQTEYLDTDGLRDYYMNRRVYDQFLIYKNQMDPDGMFNHIDNFSNL